MMKVASAPTPVAMGDGQSDAASCFWKSTWVQLRRMRNSTELCDIYLESADGEVFPAHSAVLAASSQVYHTYCLTGDPSVFQKVRKDRLLVDLDSPKLKVVLDFVYGITPDKEDNCGITSLLDGGKTLGIPGAVAYSKKKAAKNVGRKVSGLDQVVPPAATSPTDQTSLEKPHNHNEFMLDLSITDLATGVKCPHLTKLADSSGLGGDSPTTAMDTGEFPDDRRGPDLEEVADRRSDQNPQDSSEPDSPQRRQDPSSSSNVCVDPHPPSTPQQQSPKENNFDTSSSFGKYPEADSSEVDIMELTCPFAHRVQSSRADTSSNQLYAGGADNSRRTSSEADSMVQCPFLKSLGSDLPDTTGISDLVNTSTEISSNETSSSVYNNKIVESLQMLSNDDNSHPAKNRQGFEESPTWPNGSSLTSPVPSAYSQPPAAANFVKSEASMNRSAFSSPSDFGFSDNSAPVSSTVSPEHLQPPADITPAYSSQQVCQQDPRMYNNPYDFPSCGQIDPLVVEPYSSYDGHRPNDALISPTGSAGSGRYLHDLYGSSDQSDASMDAVGAALSSSDAMNEEIVARVKMSRKNEYLCLADGCPYSNKSLDYMQSHLYRKHGMGAPNKHCDVCNKAFFSTGQLRGHVKRAHRPDVEDPASEPMECPDCGLVFPNAQKRQIHLLKAHSKGRLFTCDECDFRSPRKKDVQAHIVSQHKKVPLGVQVYSCPHCEYKCTDKSRAEEHQAMHLGQPKFVCTICGKSYTSRRGMRTHLQYHSSERPHGCDLCSATFKVRSKLRDHIKLVHTHVGEKPYECSYCGHRTALRGNCNQHIRKHHPGQPMAVRDHKADQRRTRRTYDYVGLEGAGIEECRDIQKHRWMNGGETLGLNQG